MFTPLSGFPIWTDSPISVEFWLWYQAAGKAWNVFVIWLEKNVFSSHGGSIHHFVLPSIPQWIHQSSKQSPRSRLLEGVASFWLELWPAGRHSARSTGAALRPWTSPQWPPVWALWPGGCWAPRVGEQGGAEPWHLHSWYLLCAGLSSKILKKKKKPAIVLWAEFCAPQFFKS